MVMLKVDIIGAGHYGVAGGRYTDAVYGGVANGEKVVFTELVEF